MGTAGRGSENGPCLARPQDPLPAVFYKRWSYPSTKVAV